MNAITKLSEHTDFETTRRSMMEAFRNWLNTCPHEEDVSQEIASTLNALRQFQKLARRA